VATEWRYIATRLNGDGTETFLDLDVPLSGVELTDAISAPGGMTATISPTQKRMKGPDGMPLFLEWSTAIYAERNGVIQPGSGILTRSTFTRGVWQIEVTGFCGYLKDRPYIGFGEHYVEVDTIDIVRDIWADVQAGDGCDLGFQIGPGGIQSEVSVGSVLTEPEYDPAGHGHMTLQANPYKLTMYTDHDLASNIDDLAGRSPFEYHESHSWSDDRTSIDHKLEFAVPTFGEHRTDLRFVSGENIIVPPELVRDGAEYANAALVVGAGQGNQAILSYQADLTTGRLTRVIAITEQQADLQDYADILGTLAIAARNHPVDIGEATIRQSDLAPLAKIQVGDEIFIQADEDWIKDASWYRILNKKTNPEDLGSVVVTLLRSDKALLQAITSNLERYDTPS
jgi:hypothetical protein